MSDSSQTKRDYKLVIEKEPLGYVRSVVIVVSFLACCIFCLSWKKYQDYREIQWKSNSSYYSSQGRISAVLKNEGKGRITFIGSSISGRIAGAESGVNKYFNLSVDGSTAKEGIDYILSGAIPKTEYLAVELNTLMRNTPFVYKDINNLKNEKEWLELCPIADPLYRVSTLFYTELRNERLDVSGFETWPVFQKQKNHLTDSVYTPSPDEEKMLELLEKIRSESGSKLVLVAYPTPKGRAHQAKSEQERYWEWLAEKLDVPFLNLNTQIPPSVRISFSDHVHIKSKDAFIAANTIYEYANRAYHHN